MAISTAKIEGGIRTFFKSKKKTRVNGGTLFKYIGESKTKVADKILDAIKERASLAKQPTVVLEYFSNHFADVEVENSNKKRVLEIVASTYKSNHITLSELTPKSIVFTSVILKREMGDLNLFKKDIEDWKDEEYATALGFLTDITPPTGEDDE